MQPERRSGRCEAWLLNSAGRRVNVAGDGSSLGQRLCPVPPNAGRHGGLSRENTGKLMPHRPAAATGAERECCVNATPVRTTRGEKRSLNPGRDPGHASAEPRPTAQAERARSCSDSLPWQAPAARRRNRGRATLPRAPKSRDDTPKFSLSARQARPRKSKFGALTLERSAVRARLRGDQHCGAISRVILVSFSRGLFTACKTARFSSSPLWSGVCCYVPRTGSNSGTLVRNGVQRVTGGA
jgi:hypothetical protein